MNQQILWQVPPIQFIMDDTARNVSQVEELLRIADFGPDFEPTLLHNCPKLKPTLACNRVQRKLTDLSCQSDVENLAALPGPGGSVELITSKTQDHTQSSAQHSETWNDACDDSFPLDTAEDGEELKNESSLSRKMLSDGDDEALATNDTIKEDCRSNRNKNSEVCCPVAAKSMSEVRSDIYGLDHTGLWQQVVHAKHKSVNRSYKLSDELIAEFSAASDSAKNHDTHDVTVRSKIRKRKNQRHCRNSEDLLSCHYHNDIHD